MNQENTIDQHTHTKKKLPFPVTKERYIKTILFCLIQSQSKIQAIGVTNQTTCRDNHLSFNPCQTLENLTYEHLLNRFHLEEFLDDEDNNWNCPNPSKTDKKIGHFEIGIIASQILNQQITYLEARNTVALQLQQSKFLNDEILLRSLPSFQNLPTLILLNLRESIFLSNLDKILIQHLRNHLVDFEIENPSWELQSQIIKQYETQELLSWLQFFFLLP